jgi:hypothetical protein
MQKHGMKHTRIYEIWCGIKKRCYNKKCKSYPNYGGRGISVCDEWKNSFLIFYEWSIKNGYKDFLQIDRIDTNGNYCPQNCRWSTPLEQQRNKTNNVCVEHNGEIKTISEWSKELNFNNKLAYERYNRLLNDGKDVCFEYIFSNESHCKRKINQYSLDGRFIKQWESATEAGKQGFSRLAIVQCCNKKSKTSGGYIWKYAEG